MEGSSQAVDRFGPKGLLRAAEVRSGQFENAREVARLSGCRRFSRAGRDEWHLDTFDRQAYGHRIQKSLVHTNKIPYPARRQILVATTAMLTFICSGEQRPSSERSRVFRILRRG